MQTIRSMISMNTYRIPPRLRLVLSRLGSLILLFQRSPIVQFLFPEANIMGGAALANSFTLAVTTVVGLGVFDSVAGQSQISERAPLVVLGKNPAGTSPTGTTAINVPATVSAPLTFSFNWDPNNSFSSVKSWRCTTGGVVGTLPAGLGPALDPLPNPAVGVGGLITISGTPTALPGIYPVTINVYRNASYGSSTAAQIFNICVLGFSTQPAATTTISSGGTTILNCVAEGNPLTIPIVGSGPPAAQAAGTLTYEWYQGTTGTIGTILGTSSSFTTPALTTTTNYWVRLKSVLGASTVYANSTTAVVNVTSPSVTVAVAPVSVAEDGAGNLEYTFTRTGSTTAGLAINFNVGGSATLSDSDYTASGATTFTATTGTVSFAAGSATVKVTIDPTLDSTVEPNETVDLTVATGAGYTVGSPNVASGTITNDDTAYSSWASVLAVDKRGPTQTPQNDGVTNLAKFAFNMDATKPDVRMLIAGHGDTIGLPCGSMVSGKLRIEYIRRKFVDATNPGISYTPQFSSDLGTWLDATAPAGTSIDSTWERVVVDDPLGGNQRFGRVKVIQSP
ncbi:MAG: hypothetical protein NTV46_10565 [Verrucomicrobia bacterium]|nr:hypothetical protein [Verrucomicrobiota bacterium]